MYREFASVMDGPPHQGGCGSGWQSGSGEDIQERGPDVANRWLMDHDHDWPMRRV